MQGEHWTYGHCDHKKQPGGCQQHNLHCGYPDCDRRPALNTSSPTCSETGENRTGTRESDVGLEVVGWPGRQFCETAERNATELARWVRGKDDKVVASDAALAIRTLLNSIDVLQSASDARHAEAMARIAELEASYGTLLADNADVISWHEKCAFALVAAEARIAELEAQIARKDEALREAEETLALVEHPAFPDPAHHFEVKRLGRRIGFGALMSTASAAWREVLVERGDPTGSEFVSGPCFATIERTIKIVRCALGGSNG